MPSKAQIMTGVIALVAFALVSAVQRQFPIPVVGAYLPK
jgi:hypothetical protein